MATAELEQFVKITEGFDTAMLVTESAHRARPMAVQRVDPKGDIWFVTSRESVKVQEFDRDPTVVVTFQSKARFVSVTGRAVLIDDRAQIEAMWKPDWKIWFPDGPDDPTIVLVHVRVSQGEYWDQSGTKGLVFLFDAARALVAGKAMEDDEDPGKHGHVRAT